MSFSTVIMHGVLMERKPEGLFRQVKISRINPLEDYEDEVLIPCLYWDYQENNPLLKLKKGQSVIIKGRLDSSSEHPVFILVEKVEVM